MKKMKRKLIATLVVMLFALASTIGATFAYWNILQVEQAETVTVGEGVALEMAVVATAPSGKTLVPTGQVLDSATQVDSITLTYNVKLSRILTSGLTLGVTASNIKIGASTTYASLVNVNISSANSIVNGSNVLVTVVITLTEPADVTEYNAVVNQDITFTLTFVATV